MLLRILGLTLFFTLAAWITAPTLRADNVDRQQMNHGYALLRHLCDEESQVDLILIVKTTPPNVASFTHEISKSAQDDMKILDNLADEDPAIHFDDRGLPAIETQTRDSIKAEKQHLLLFGSKGGDFAKTLVLTQIEASTYGENMAKVMAGDETSGHRAAELRQVAGHWEKIKDKAYLLLYRM